MRPFPIEAMFHQVKVKFNFFLPDAPLVGTIGPIIPNPAGSLRRTDLHPFQGSLLTASVPLGSDILLEFLFPCLLVRGEAYP